MKSKLKKYQSTKSDKGNSVKPTDLGTGRLKELANYYLGKFTKPKRSMIDTPVKKGPVIPKEKVPSIQMAKKGLNVKSSKKK